MKNITFLLCFITFLFAGFLKRDETDKYTRDNPVDETGIDYQGWETRDTTGDGEGDYTITINSVVTDPNIEIIIQDGPRADFIFISTNSDLSLALQMPFSQMITYNFMGDYGTNVLYIGFEFYNGRRSDRIYSNQFVYAESNSLVTEWNNYNFTMTLNNGEPVVTSTNLSFVIDAPAQTWKYRFGEVLTSTNLVDFPSSGSNVYHIQHEPFVKTVTLIAELHSFTNGLTRIISNSITYSPWQGFTVVINSNAAETKMKDVMLSIEYPPLADYMKIGNEIDLSDSGGWEPVSSNKSWTLKVDTNVSRTVYIVFSNVLYSLYSQVVSDTIDVKFELPAPSGFSSGGMLSFTSSDTSNFFVSFSADTNSWPAFQDMSAGNYDFRGQLFGPQLYFRLSNISLGSISQPYPCADFLSLRDRGPGGGYIFYDRGFYSNGWRYMEAAPSDQSTSAAWGCDGVLVPGFATYIMGKGKDNTSNIIAAGCAGAGTAAYLCNAYSRNAYDDWFLPSRDEFDQVYINLHQQGVGGFSDTGYWSSSSTVANDAAVLFFNTGQDFTLPKSIGYYVRACRQF